MSWKEIGDKLRVQAEPERDLWPDIREELERGHAGARRSPEWLKLAAAVILGVLIAPWVWNVARQDEPAEGPTVPAALTVSHPWGQELYEPRAAVLAALDQRRDELAPETVRAIEENLRIIDSAILEIQEALAENPDDPSLNLQLAAKYQQEFEIVRRLMRRGASSQAPESRS